MGRPMRVRRSLRKHGVEHIANEIHGENANCNLASPLGATGETKGGETAGCADGRHERD